MARINPDWVKEWLKWDGFRFVERRPQPGVRLICVANDETNQFRLVELCEHLNSKLGAALNKEVTQRARIMAKEMREGEKNERARQARKNARRTHS